jgi:hypothetical protein
MTNDELNLLCKERQDAERQLEAIIDRYQWDAVMGMLSQICYEKASHLRTSYADNVTARRYEVAARAFSRVADPLRETCRVKDYRTII